MGQIGLFGGSFDPPHCAHAELINSCLNSAYCDEIWVLPSRVSPFKQGREVTAYEHRYEMARRAFGNMPRVFISDVERHLPPPSYTLKTLEHLQQQFPGHSWRLCIGSDNLASFERWYGYSDILRIAELLVALRPGYDSRRETEEISPEILKHTHFVEHEPRRLSSTHMRKMLHNKQPARSLPPAVRAYINEKNLYQA
ncbi:MAG: nicotinate (nicotinamide) nucleotide adenylyltransferase [Cyclonatronaceae bacterium]